MEFIRQNLLLIAVALVSGGMLLFSSIRRPGGGSAVTPTQATQLINREDALVIDVREPEEYAAGHLPEARNVPAAQIESRAGELDKYKEKPLILVCQSGARSAGACRRLKALGFTKVHNLEGGIDAWRTAGLPIRKGARK